MIDCRVDLSSCLNFINGRESGEAKEDSDEGGMDTDDSKEAE